MDINLYMTRPAISRPGVPSLVQETDKLVTVRGQIKFYGHASGRNGPDDWPGLVVVGA